MNGSKKIFIHTPGHTEHSMFRAWCSWFFWQLSKLYKIWRVLAYRNHYSIQINPSLILTTLRFFKLLFIGALKMHFWPFWASLEPTKQPVRYSRRLEDLSHVPKIMRTNYQSIESQNIEVKCPKKSINGPFWVKIQ